jgi:hypothetical protein
MALVPTGVRPEFLEELAERDVTLPAGLFLGSEAVVAMKRIVQFLVPLTLAGWPSHAGARTEAQAAEDDAEVILAIDTSGSMRPAIDAAKSGCQRIRRIDAGRCPHRSRDLRRRSRC